MQTSNNFKSIVKNYIYIPLVLIVSFIVFKFILLYGIIPTGSMEPTCPSNSFYIANGMFYKLQNNVSRGDIVVFYSAEYDTRFVKRVIGLPNDTIDIIDGSVYVNGTLLDESEYLSADICTDSEQTHFEVPDDSYFMLGDNREYSNDSRYWENPYISYDALEGKILATFKF